MSLERALEEWKRVVGKDGVLTDAGTLQAARSATFPTDQEIPAIIRPANVEDLQEVVRIACRHKIAVHPVSAGRNWGLGSRVPTHSGSVLVELHRLNEIGGHDDTLGTLRVQAGVTFRQATDYLKEHDSSRFLAVIGGPPTASVIGNLVERGEGIGATCDRANYACGLKVVTPTGELIETGFRRIPQAKTSDCSKWGLGPSYDGLFTQSNLGIVVEATIWLPERPKVFETFVIAVRDPARIPAITDAMRTLANQHVVHPGCFALWNDYKSAASYCQFPFEGNATDQTLPRSELIKLKGEWGDATWLGQGGIFAASSAQARANRKIVKRTLGPLVDRLTVINETTARLAEIFHVPIRWFTGIDARDLIRFIYRNSPFLGNPTDRSLRSVYWRKNRSIPEVMDPDRDLCGMQCACVAIPLRGEDVHHAVQVAEEVITRYGFEPNLAMVYPNERVAHMFPFILYDREVVGADEKAQRAHDELLERFVSNGFYPYRLGVQSMQWAHETEDTTYAKLYEALKGHLDPEGILAPGRYEPTKGERGGAQTEPAAAISA